MIASLEDYDEYRESNPAHEAQSIAELLSDWNVEVEMPERPAGKMVQCESCHEWFEAEPQAFNAHWLFPNLCDPNCNPALAEIIAQCEPGRSRSFQCPRCGIAKSVEPVLSGTEWHYYGQCSHCGQKWVNCYKLRRKCAACGKFVYITNRNPKGQCKCDGGGPERPF